MLVNSVFLFSGSLQSHNLIFMWEAFYKYKCFDILNVRKFIK